MIDSYWDLYVAYIAKCVKENKERDIDPHHYEMEWNHFLPKCLFDDQPVGHYLTLKQHAIASALQTLALRKNCMTGMMKEYLPEKLLELAWPSYRLAYTGEFNPMFGKKNPALSERNKLQTGELHPMFGKTDSDEIKRKKSEAKKGKKNSMFGRTGELHPTFGRTGELNPAFGKKWWVNNEGKTYLGVESPGPEWQNGRK
jgi:hypothetical protein